MFIMLQLKSGEVIAGRMRQSGMKEIQLIPVVRAGLKSKYANNVKRDDVAEYLITSQEWVFQRWLARWDRDFAHAFGQHGPLPSVTIGEMRENLANTAGRWVSVAWSRFWNAVQTKANFRSLPFLTHGECLGVIRPVQPPRPEGTSALPISGRKPSEPAMQNIPPR